jgi:aspartate/methionine/tyrosine aminotransferase
MKAFSTMTVSPAAVSDLLVSPFPRLAALIGDTPPGVTPAVNLHIGEPRHAFPAVVGPALAGALAGFGAYPPMKGTDAFRAAAATWATKRFSLSTPVDPDREVLPLNGSREGLFYAAVEARLLSGKADPAILLPNPFYQAYAAGCAAAGATPLLIATGPDGRLDPASIPADYLKRAIALYWASPANPQGTVTSDADWQALVTLCRANDILLFADECYSEIYRDVAVPGVLKAAEHLGGGYANIIAFNSLSKRSNLPGLRVGFAIGDATFLAKWLAFRNMSGPQVPTPLLAAATAVLGDETHVIENRRLYNEKFAAAERILGPQFGKVTPPGGFCLWLDVARFGDDTELTRRLWAEQGVRVLPGSYLAGIGADGVNPGAGFIRIALVEPLPATETALSRLVTMLSQET